MLPELRKRRSRGPIQAWVLACHSSSALPSCAAVRGFSDEGWKPQEYVGRNTWAGIREYLESRLIIHPFSWTVSFSLGPVTSTVQSAWPGLQTSSVAWKKLVTPATLIPRLLWKMLLTWRVTLKFWPLIATFKTSDSSVSGLKPGLLEG